MTGEEKAVIQEEEEETFERVDGFYLEVEYKGDIHSRLERHNKLFLFFRCLASWWVTCWNFTMSRKVFQRQLRCGIQLQITLWFRSFSGESWCVLILSQPFWWSTFLPYTNFLKMLLFDKCICLVFSAFGLIGFDHMTNQVSRHEKYHGKLF